MTYSYKDSDTLSLADAIQYRWLATTVTGLTPESTAERAPNHT